MFGCAWGILLATTPVNYPPDAAMAGMLAMLFFAQAIPAAGLLALLRVRWGNRRVPAGLKVVAGLSFVAFVLQGLLLGVVPIVAPTLLLVLTWALTGGLARQRPGWVGLWLAGSAACFVADLYATPIALAIIFR